MIKIDGTIVIADDNADLLNRTVRIAERTLQGSGVIICGSGGSLYTVLGKTTDTGLVITDLNMPGKRLEEILAEHHNKAPFVITTDDPEGARLSEKYGAIYLRKPFEISEFENAVINALTAYAIERVIASSQ